jgi:hypothetical protein
MNEWCDNTNLVLLSTNYKNKKGFIVPEERKKE